jgi:DNA-binding IclR family transcriptional regulator
MDKWGYKLMAKITSVEDQDESTGGGSRAPAVARAASVLRLLASERTGLGVSEIARRIGLVPSTCLHVLRALVEEGFVTFDEQKKTYNTGVGLLTLVRDAMASSPFPRVVQPALDEIAAEQHVTATALEIDARDRMVVVALARSDAFISLHLNIGARFPAMLGATGRCFAAVSNFSREELKERFAQLRWEKAPRFEDWVAEVERARVEGVAVDRGYYIRGLTAIATLLPVGADRRLRGIASIGFEHRMTERAVRQVKDVLIAARQTVASRLQ